MLISGKSSILVIVKINVLLLSEQASIKSCEFSNSKSSSRLDSSIKLVNKFLAAALFFSISSRVIFLSSSSSNESVIFTF